MRHRAGDLQSYQRHRRSGEMSGNKIEIERRTMGSGNYMAAGCGSGSGGGGGGGSPRWGGRGGFAAVWQPVAGRAGCTRKMPDGDIIRLQPARSANNPHLETIFIQG